MKATIDDLVPGDIFSWESDAIDGIFLLISRHRRSQLDEYCLCVLVPGAQIELWNPSWSWQVFILS